MAKKARISHKANVDTSGGKFYAPTLTHMRGVIAPSIELNRRLRKNAEVRDDDAIIAAAQAKRERKMKRNLKGE